MSWWNAHHDRGSANKMFCSDCQLIQKDNHICSKCGSHTVSAGKKMRWPAHPKKSDYEHMASTIAYNISSGYPHKTFESVTKFVLRYGNSRDAKNVEVALNYKLKKEKEEREAPVMPETLSANLDIPAPLKEFMFEREDGSNAKWVVNARVLFNGAKFDKKHLRKIFIPKITKIYNKGGHLYVSNGVPTYSNINGLPKSRKSDLAFFSNEEDALIYSHELARIVVEEDAKYKKTREKYTPKQLRDEFLEEHNRGRNIDKRIVEEAMLHLRYCKESLIDTFPHYYITV